MKSEKRNEKSCPLDSFSCIIEEGTIIEISVKKSGMEAVTTNMKVQQSDLELFESLKDLRS